MDRIYYETRFWSFISLYSPFNHRNRHLFSLLEVAANSDLAQIAETRFQMNSTKSPILALGLLHCGLSACTPPSSKPGSNRPAVLDSSKTPRNPVADDPQSPEEQLCSPWNRLGPRFSYVADETSRFRELGLGTEAPFSIRLPGTLKPASWWLEGGLSPTCEAAGSECWSVPFRMFEEPPTMGPCGEEPRNAVIRAVTMTAYSAQIDPKRPEAIEAFKPDCGIRSGHLGLDKGEVPKQTSYYNFSLDRGICVAEASNLASWVDEEPSLHYLAVMRFDLQASGYLRQVAIVYVVDERDWSMIGDSIRSSALSFQVDWNAYDKRYPRH